MAGGAGGALCPANLASEGRFEEIEAHETDRGDRPEKVIVVNRSLGNLENLKTMVESLETDIVFEYVHNSDPQVNDGIMARLPESSIVINATGAGKDFPGSPVTDEGIIPKKGIAWEINYRGALDFWHQSMAQKESRGLFVEDGWLYFLHGWTQVVAEVLHLHLDTETFTKLAEAAKELRPPLIFNPLDGMVQVD